MNIDFDKAYKLVKRLDEKRTKSALNPESIDEQATDSNELVEEGLCLFPKYVSEAPDLAERGVGLEEDALVEKIMYLRIHAITSVNVLMNSLRHWTVF